MPEEGGLSPYPLRQGGGVPNLQRVIESLGAQLGTAYDVTTPTGTVYIRLTAYARAINALWEQNQRLANQWDPQRMTDFLPRWERILGLSPLVTDTDVQRRARIQVAMSQVGYARQQDVTDALTAVLGSNFVTLVTQSSATANVWTPASWPIGSHDASGAIDWYSSIAMLMVQVQKSPNQTDAQFYAKLAGIYSATDGMLPGWTTLDWFRQDISNRAGFWLDEIDLDNEAFDA